MCHLDADRLAWLRREAFGFVFQGYHLIPSESACENVEMPAIYAGLPATATATGSGAAGAAGAGAAPGQPAHQLSGGQQQRCRSPAR
jgi:macrolide transport system ATP-binding/permease protein